MAYVEHISRSVTRVVNLGNFESVRIETGLERDIQWETPDERLAKTLAADAQVLDDLDRLARHTMARIRAEAVPMRETPPQVAQDVPRSPVGPSEAQKPARIPLPFPLEPGSLPPPGPQDGDWSSYPESTPRFGI